MSAENNNFILYGKATAILQKLYGDNAAFRAGQYAAVEAVMTHRRTLLVQRTGWGKGFVYLACTKLLRAKGKGVTLVVEPTALLKQAQTDSAEKAGLVCADILDTARRAGADLLAATAEELLTEDVRAWVEQTPIGLLVIDEAQCMSERSCDHIPAYGGLKALLSRLPEDVPVLAVTATATEPVISELKELLGADVFVSKGTLARDNLYLQVLNLPDAISRYAWLLQNLPKLEGSGIIYCPTPADCEALASFLRENGIAAEVYDTWSEEHSRTVLERFRRNELKALVTVSELGMGYDKGDVAFVIHTRMPPSIVTYSREIGRAGRNLPKAYVFLMHSHADERVLNQTADGPAWEQMKRMVYLQGCYHKYIASCLDDPTAADCGQCANCMGFELFPAAPSARYADIAEAYLKESFS